MNTTGRPAPAEAAGLAHGDVVRLCGDILDWKVSAIIQTGATLQELEEAVAWAAGESDAMGRARKPLSATVAEVYDILASDEDEGEDRRAAP